MRIFSGMLDKGGKAHLEWQPLVAPHNGDERDGGYRSASITILVVNLGERHVTASVEHVDGSMMNPRAVLTRGG